jgi:hypothetical protein
MSPFLLPALSWSLFMHLTGRCLLSLIRCSRTLILHGTALAVLLLLSLLVSLLMMMMKKVLLIRVMMARAHTPLGMRSYDGCASISPLFLRLFGVPMPKGEKRVESRTTGFFDCHKPWELLYLDFIWLVLVYFELFKNHLLFPIIRVWMCMDDYYVCYSMLG